MLVYSVSARLSAAARHPARSGRVVGLPQLARAILVAAALLVPSLSTAPPASAQDLSDCVITDPTCTGWPDPQIHIDRDHDGLYDGDEPLHFTDPDLWDTDGDEFSDGDEVRSGSVPWDPSSTPWVPPDTGPGPIDESGSGGGGGFEIPELICESGELIDPVFGPTGFCAPHHLIVLEP